ncbi:MAG: hypothetical protein HFJ09_11175 [Lachnospiraceae bacterium]|nr:hypothetical protein [Lachnospiraceae bacterium]
MIAPIIVTLILCLYNIGFVALCFVAEEIPFVVKVLGGVIPFALACVSIYVLIERIKEIRSGEEDDLSKY